jgi:hypothetical protein
MRVARCLFVFLSKLFNNGLDWREPVELRMTVIFSISSEKVKSIVKDSSAYFKIESTDLLK